MCWVWWENIPGPGTVAIADRFAAATTVHGSIVGTCIRELHAFDGAHVWDTLTVSLKWVADQKSAYNPKKANSCVCLVTCEFLLP